MGAPEGIEIEMLLSAPAAGIAEAASQRGVVEQPPERRRELLLVTWGDEDPGDFVGDELGNAPDSGRHHGQPRRHRLQDGERHPLGVAREHEHVAAGEQVAHVVTLAVEVYAVREAQAHNLLLHPTPVGPFAHQNHLEGSGRHPLEGAYEGDEVLGSLEPADGDYPRWVTSVRGAWRCGDVDRVRDHERPRGITRRGAEAGRAFALRHADRRRRQRPDEPICPAIQPRRQARVCRERPAVDGEDADRNAGEQCRETPEHTGLGAVRMDDVRALAPQQPHELDERHEIAPRAHATAEMHERDEPDPRHRSGIDQGARPVGRNDDIEAVGQRGEQRGDVRLSAAHLGERDQQDDPRPRRT